MNVETTSSLLDLLAAITFTPSGVGLHAMDLRWEVEALVRLAGERRAVTEGVLTEPLGWRVRLTFDRPDRETGAVGRGAGRWELIEHGASEFAVVKTCWLLLELLVRHELMESFLYRGERIFDPHKTVDQLAGYAEKRLAEVARSTTRAAAYTIRLTDPSTVPRDYPACAFDREGVCREACAFLSSVLSGGTVEVYQGAPDTLTHKDEPVEIWTRA